GPSFSCWRRPAPFGSLLGVRRCPCGCDGPSTTGRIMAKSVKCPICAGSFDVAETALGPTAHCPPRGKDFAPGSDPAAQAATHAAAQPAYPEQTRAALNTRARALLAVGLLGALVNLLWVIRSSFPGLLPANSPWLAQPTGTSLE